MSLGFKGVATVKLPLTEGKKAQQSMESKMMSRYMAIVAGYLAFLGPHLKDGLNSETVSGYTNN